MRQAIVSLAAAVEAAETAADQLAVEAAVAALQLLYRAADMKVAASSEAALSTKTL